jgi:hypothetical protein
VQETSLGLDRLALGRTDRSEEFRQRLAYLHRVERAVRSGLQGMVDFALLDRDAGGFD